jgi:hypothetical protein
MTADRSVPPSSPKYLLPGPVFRPIVRSLTLLLPALVGGCAALPLACLPPSQPMVSAEMLFGRAIGDRIAVTEAAFGAFVATEIAPRFPDGLAVIDTRGQWRDARRNIVVHEPGKLVKLVFADDPQKRRAIEEVAAAYRERFRQQSVLTSLQVSCAKF